MRERLPFERERIQPPGARRAALDPKADSSRHHRRSRRVDLFRTLDVVMSRSDRKFRCDECGEGISASGKSIHENGHELEGTGILCRWCGWELPHPTYASAEACLALRKVWRKAEASERKSRGVIPGSSPKREGRMTRLSKKISRGPKWVKRFCSGGCGKSFRVIEAVKFILCGRETCTLARVREKRRKRA